MKRAMSRPHGFSLVELAVVLAITGALGLVTWKLIPALRPVAEGDRAQQSLLEAQQALEGYINLAHRLPCPDNNDDGLENCAASNTVGKLPWRTLGISTSKNLRYGVYRNANTLASQDADLAVLKDRYIPTLPEASSLQQNGLDFCRALRTAMRNPTALNASGVPVAYALAHPGNNGQFDAANATTTGFELTGQARTASYDDATLAVGLAELSGRLSCPERLGKVQSAAHSAYTAYDVDRNALLYQDFRALGVEVKANNQKMAAVTLTLATSDLANALATSATAIAIAAVTKGVGAVTLVTAGASILAAELALRGAAAGIVTTALAKAVADKRKTAADTFRIHTLTASLNALQAAKDADQKGLTP